MQVGIVSFGAYIPRFRIKTAEIARVWGVDGKSIERGLNILSKSVSAPDEDTATISVEAARAALLRANLDPQELGAIYVGSESHPYAVKPTATIVAEALGAAPELTAADYEFACKAATAAIQTCMGLVRGGYIKYGMAVGADTAQAAPADALEYSASAGGAAFIIGAEKVVATINSTFSYTTDTPDFWRREGAKYPSHGERFTGAPAYFRHIIECSKRLLAQMRCTPEDYDYAIFHQPNGKFPATVARTLGFSKAQIERGLLTPIIGNTYSASMLLGLIRVLEYAKPGERIFAVAYGSGAGADAFDITVTQEIENFNFDAGTTIDAMLNSSTYIDYAVYAKYREKIAFR